MEQATLPDWESQLIEEAIATAERRLEEEDRKAKKRAIQLAREQGYHRLAVEIDRPSRHRAGPGQLSLFPVDPTLFDVKD
jgi:flagellar biosynthesis/type III secretory pathway protein FliH